MPDSHPRLPDPRDHLAGTWRPPLPGCLTSWSAIRSGKVRRAGSSERSGGRAALDRDIAVVGRRACLCQCRLDSVGDEVVRGGAVHRPRLARVVGKHEDCGVERRIVAPPTVPPGEPGLHDRVRGSDGVAGGFGVLAAPGRGGPAEGAVGELIDGPPGLLLEPVVVRHFGPPLHRQVRPPASYGMLCSKSHWLAGRRQTGLVQVACRIWDRCRSLTPGSWPRAGAGARSPGVEGVDRDDQVGPAAGDAQPPGAVPAGRAVPAGGGEGEPGPARRRPGPGACPRGSWVRAGRSRGRRRGRARRSPSRTRSSPGSARRRRPGRGPATGRPGPCPASSPGRSARPAAVPSGTVRVTCPANPPAAPPAGPAPGGCCAAPPSCPSAARGRAGPGVRAENQVQEGAGAQLVHPAVQPGRLQLAAHQLIR